MTNGLKISLVGIGCFALGAAALYGWNSYVRVQEENLRLKEMTTVKPTPIVQVVKMGENAAQTPPTLPPESATPTPFSAVQMGGISGSLGYPSEGIPPLQVYAFSKSDYSKFYSVTTQQNQENFTISQVPVGEYVVVAYTKDGGVSGGYTKMVPCGLLASCTDHSLIPVSVKSGETLSGVEVKDWYAPANTFPSKP